MKFDDENRLYGWFMGDELGEMIKKLNTQHFLCTCGEKIRPDHEVQMFHGYTHDGGLHDKDGDRHWLYLNCPKCKYSWAWHKLPARARLCSQSDINQTENLIEKAKAELDKEEGMDGNDRQVVPGIS